MEEVGALGRKEAVEHAPDALDQSIDSSCGLVPQQRLELCEGHLYRVHVGAVGRQVEDLGSAVGDRFADAGHLVGGQVVEHHNVAALERGAKDLADVDAEGIAIHRTIEHPRRGHAAQPQSGDEGHGFPMPERHAVVAPLAERCPAIQPCHLRVDARLVEEDEALRIDERLRRSPQLALRGDVGAILLGCAQGFF
jgi:hypothetical protein